MRFSKCDIDLCPSGPATYRYTIDGTIDTAAIRRMGADLGGELEYFPAFARPFYRIYSREKKIQIRGVEGEKDFTVAFMGRENTASISFFDAVVGALPEQVSEEK